jgi:hypothetical protein
MNLHRTDKLSLVFGLFFLTITVIWLLVGQLDVDLPTAGWFIAGGLIVFGVLGLVGSMRPRTPVESADGDPAGPED